MGYRRLLGVFLACALLLAVGVRPASAHAILVRSEPADGAVLDAPPQQIRLWFSEPVALNLSAVELIDGAGRAVAIQNVRAAAADLAVAVRSEQASTVQVLVDVPRLTPGVYRMRWRALSNSDLHNTAGMIVFGVQHAASAAAVPALEVAPAPLEVVLRWGNLAALLVLLGTLALALLALPRAARAAPAAEHAAALRVRLLMLAEWAGLAALLAGLALLLVQAYDVAGPAVGATLAGAWQIMSGTSYGNAWMVRQAALLGMGAALPLARRKPGAYSLVGPALLALAALVAQALQGHAAATVSFIPLRVAANALHLLGAGVWAGGLAALVFAVLPLVRAERTAAPLGWAVLRGFGALAAAGLAALTVSGMLLMAQQVASIDALLMTLYGRALLLKLVLVVLAALLGLSNAARLHAAVARLLRRAQPAAQPRVARTVLAEALVALAIVLGAAVLGAAPPARGPEFDPPAIAEAPPLATSRADDLVVTAALKPNRSGQNFVTLGVFDTRRPAPAPIGQVAVQLVPQGGSASPELVANDLGKGRYEIVDATLASAGAWQIQVIVRRAGLPDAVTAIPWAVLPPTRAARPVLVSAAPLAPWLTAAAGVVALAAVGAAGIWLRRCRPGVARARTLIHHIAE